ncbi:hypothetical protein D4R51_02855 [bacterium]|nr:MAG: hypothetical protein D4R51_02855 [bacterium]
MLDNVLKSKWLRITLVILGALVVLLIIFRLGMFVGEKRADFRNHWGENYGKFFGEPRRGFFGELPGGGPRNPFGNAGTVLSVENNIIVTKGSDNSEKIIVVASSTVIMEREQAISVSDVRPGELIVAIGSPNEDGQIEAKFIRVFPEPAANPGPPKR